MICDDPRDIDGCVCSFLFFFFWGGGVWVLTVIITPQVNTTTSSCSVNSLLTNKNKFVRQII